MPVEFAPFQVKIVVDFALHYVAMNEMVDLAVHLTVPDRPGGVRQHGGELLRFGLHEALLERSDAHVIRCADQNDALSLELVQPAHLLVEDQLGIVERGVRVQRIDRLFLLLHHARSADRRFAGVVEFRSYKGASLLLELLCLRKVESQSKA